MEVKTIRIVERNAVPAVLDVGNRNDNKVTAVQFVLPSFLEGENVKLNLRVRNFDDVVNLPADRKWVLTADHTQVAGGWTAWLECDLKNGAHWTCDAFTLTVGDHPGDGGERLKKQYPTAFDNAMKAVDALLNADVSATTLPAGNEATAGVRKDAEGNLTIVYGIPKGERGEQGIQGIQGIQGERGEQGIQGIQGIQGERGLSGVPMLEVGSDGCLYLLDATNIIYTLTENGELEVEVNG